MLIYGTAQALGDIWFARASVVVGRTLIIPKLYPNGAVTTWTQWLGSVAVGRGALVIHLGREELVIRKRYEALSIANDVLIGLWFLVGSLLFFSESTTYAATWLFVIGSVEMLIRPVIRLVRHLHLQRFHPEAGSAAAAGNDF